MSTSRNHKIPKLKGLAGVGVVLAAVLLAACGGSSSPQQGKTQTARPTSAQSGADVGTAQAQSKAPHHSGGTSSASSPSGAIVGGPSQGSKVVKAHPTPATSSDDTSSEDTTRTALANTFNPCTLVSLAEAQSITGGAVAGRVEAPLGPTCIYARKGSSQRITLAVESTNFGQVTRQLAKRRAVVVNGRNGYCGRLGSQMLFVQLPANRTLHIVAPCAVAQRFAAAALNRLTA
jgi:hypothetical protein